MLGPLPTPAIAYLTQALRAQAGVVISASHNPFEDNGLKFFSAAGAKLDEAIEAAIENELEEPFATVDPARLGRARRLDDAVGRYVEFCKSTFDDDRDLRGLSLVVDCANGATYRAAPQVFSELGATVHTVGCAPDGLNINLKCGSTHPESLQRAVVDRGAGLGIAFDGDGDRVVMVGPDGRLLDGDDLLYVLARDYHARDALGGPVVGTVMSNLGLEKALASHDIPFRRTKVGDRNVLAALKSDGGVLGGEPSGHLLCLDRATTGDGIVAALQVLQGARRSGRSVAEIAADVTKLPQVMRNVRNVSDVALDAPTIRAAVAEAETRLGDRGRVLLRASGTEPLVRVMVEGEDVDEVERECDALVAVVTQVCAAVDARV